MLDNWVTSDREQRLSSWLAGDMRRTDQVIRLVTDLGQFHGKRPESSAARGSSHLCVLALHSFEVIRL